MASSSYSPPPHFSILHPLLYRSASPLPPSFPYLHSLHLETVISLGPDPPTRALLTFCTNEGVRLLDLGGREREEGIKEGLEFLLERENEPCLVVDQSGIHETGILMGCLRKLEGWSLSSILSECASIAGSKSRGSNEQFIELFDTDLVSVPGRDKLVSWFNPQIAE